MRSGSRFAPAPPLAAAACAGAPHARLQLTETSTLASSFRPQRSLP